MSYAWVLPTNVVQIARELLQMDKESFEKVAQQELTAQLSKLEEALYQFLFPTEPQGYRYKYSQIEETELHLLKLMQCTQHVLSLLTLAKRYQLQSALETRIAMSDVESK